MSHRLSRRRLLSAAGGAAAGAALGPLASRLRERRHVVLIVADALRADRLGALRGGGSISPNLDALARRALVFENCYSASTWTKTSVASILTGENPPYHGVLGEADTLPRGCDAIGDVLRREGYLTWAIQTNPWLEAEPSDDPFTPVTSHGFHKGFELYHFLAPPPAKGEDEGEAYADAERVNSELREMFLDEKRRSLEGGGEPVGRSELLKADWNLEASLFLYVHFMDTHQPWMAAAPRETTGIYCSRPRGRRPGQIHRDDRELVRDVLSRPEHKTSDDETRRIREIYDEAVTYLDGMLARTLDYIDRYLGLERTTIIFTSDHGDELYEHGRYGHMHHVYEEVTRVPLLVAGPGMRPGRVAGLVSNVSIYRTLRSLVGAGPVGEGAPGRPLVTPEALGTGRIGGEPIVSVLTRPAGCPENVLTKYIREDLEAAIIETGPSGAPMGVERYHLSSDPGEENPLREAGGEEFVTFADRWWRYWRDLARRRGVDHAETKIAWQRDFTWGPAQKDKGRDLTPEEKRMREQMRALGYLH